MPLTGTVDAVDRREIASVLSEHIINGCTHEACQFGDAEEFADHLTDAVIEVLTDQVEPAMKPGFEGAAVAGAINTPEEYDRWKA